MAIEKRVEVFGKLYDDMLLSMTHEEDGTKVYEILPEGVSLERLITNKHRTVEKEFLAFLTLHNINLQQPLIGRIKNENDPLDMETVVMYKDFYIHLGYYSVGSSVSQIIICKFLSEAYFDLDSGDFGETETVFVAHNTEPIDG